MRSDKSPALPSARVPPNAQRTAYRLSCSQTSQLLSAEPMRLQYLCVRKALLAFRPATCPSNAERPSCRNQIGPLIKEAGARAEAAHTRFPFGSVDREFRQASE